MNAPALVLSARDRVAAAERALAIAKAGEASNAVRLVDQEAAHRRAELDAALAGKPRPRQSADYARALDDSRTLPVLAADLANELATAKAEHVRAVREWADGIAAEIYHADSAGFREAIAGLFVAVERLTPYGLDGLSAVNYAACVFDGADAVAAHEAHMQAVNDALAEIGERESFNVSAGPEHARHQARRTAAGWPEMAELHEHARKLTTA